MKNIIVLLVTVAAVAVAVQPGFDPVEVVRQVRGAGRGVSRAEYLASDNGEFLIDTSIAYAPAPRDRDLPAVAFDGTNWLVVWRDGRGQIDTADIYGTRVTQAGVILDPLGIAISTAANDQWSPAVAFDGTNFLVVWADKRSGDTADIYGARVTQAGAVIDSLGIAVTTMRYDQWSPNVAFDGTNFLVVWASSTSSSYSDIYGARVTRAGVVLDPSGIIISSAQFDQWSPAVAFDGTNSLVVWTDWRGGLDDDIFVARVTPAGVVLDPSGIPISTAADDQGEPAVAFDGTNYLVVWEDGRGSDTSDIYGARVTPGGVVLDTSGIAVSTATGYQGFPAVAFDGTNYLAAWTDKRGDAHEVYGARVSPSGTVLDPSGIPISTAANWQGFPAIAFDGTNFLVVWNDWRGFDYEVYGARVTQAGVVLDSAGIPVSTVANSQSYPAVSSDGTNYLVVWEDRRSGHADDIYGARVTQAGVVLDTVGFAISTASNSKWFPSVAFDGTNYLVVWAYTPGGSYSDIYGARVTPEGVVLDTAGIAISTATNSQWYPAVSFDGTSYLVVWEDYRSGADIYAARVTPAGVVLDTAGITISAAANDQISPVVASDGTRSLVVWRDKRSGTSDIYGARVTPAGVVLEPSGIPISAAANDQTSPAVTFDGTNFLTVWTDQRNGGWDIYGARVTRSGYVPDPAGIPVSRAANNQESPAVAFGDTSFLVVWTDQRSAAWDIYGARVTSAGVVFDSGAVVTQEGYQQEPALVRGTGSQVFLVYQGWASAVGGKTYNTDRIWGMFAQFVGVQETSYPEVRTPSFGPTIVRGVLQLPPASGAEYGASSLLLDIAGREVLALRPGHNSIEGLAPGVYFVHAGIYAAVQKVAILR